MRVNVQYSIDLENLFQEMLSIYKSKVEVQLLPETHIALLRKRVQDSLQQEDVDWSRQSIDLLRKELFKLDSSLNDIDSMLAGYQQLQETEQKTAETQRMGMYNTEEVNVESSENDES